MMARFKTVSILFVAMLSGLVIVLWWLTQHGFSARINRRRWKSGSPAGCVTSPYRHASDRL
ncbi:MAG: hypothetical protein ABI945_00425 [Nitrospirales bacterium]